MAFKMKGSSLYGKLNLNKGGQANGPDGRAKSSAFQVNEEGQVAKAKKTIGTIKSTMSKAELRDWVIANNKGKGASDKSRMSQATATGIWRAGQPKEKPVEEKAVVKPLVEKPVEKPVEEPVVEESTFVEDTTPTYNRPMYAGNPTLQPGYGKKKKKK